MITINGSNIKDSLLKKILENPYIRSSNSSIFLAPFPTSANSMMLFLLRKKIKAENLLTIHLEASFLIMAVLSIKYNQTAESQLILKLYLEEITNKFNKYFNQISISKK